MSGLLSQRVLGCRAEDAAADAHREVLADNLLQLLGAVLAREHIEGRHPLGPGHMHGTVDIRAALEQQANHRGAAVELQRGALRARARAMYTTEGDCRDANFAIASVLAERFRARQAKKTG